MIFWVRGHQSPPKSSKIPGFVVQLLVAEALGPPGKFCSCRFSLLATNQKCWWTPQFFLESHLCWLNPS
jgi:hypothetical protein